MPDKRYPPVSEEEMKKKEDIKSIPVLKEHEPESVYEMTRQRYKGHHTICQALRDIYAISDNEDVKMLARLAMAMAKAMHKKLKKYKAKELIKNETLPKP